MNVICNKININRTVRYDGPDKTLIDKQNKTSYLIDISIPNTSNI